MLYIFICSIDKKKIGDFIQMAPDDLKFLGGIDWKHLDRGNKRMFDLGIDMVIEGVDELVERMLIMKVSRSQPRILGPRPLLCERGRM